jgi:hypothetical protein
MRMDTTQQSPFTTLPTGQAAEPFAVLEQRPAAFIGGSLDSAEKLARAGGPNVGLQATPLVGRLHGFDLMDQPLVVCVPALAGQVLTARTTVPLRQSMIGRDVVLCFENGDVAAPIIMGVIEPHPLADPMPPAGTEVSADGMRHVIQAEREIVLRCGEASITLTRAGKVIIQGKYILSRSSGYNKIKGAAVDIN